MDPFQSYDMTPYRSVLDRRKEHAFFFVAQLSAPRRTITRAKRVAIIPSWNRGIHARSLRIIRGRSPAARIACSHVLDMNSAIKGDHTPSGAISLAILRSGSSRPLVWKIDTSFLQILSELRISKPNLQLRPHDKPFCSI